MQKDRNMFIIGGPKTMEEDRNKTITRWIQCMLLPEADCAVELHDLLMGYQEAFWPHRATWPLLDISGFKALVVKAYEGVHFLAQQDTTLICGVRWSRPADDSEQDDQGELSCCIP